MQSSKHPSVDYGAVFSHLIEQLDTTAENTSRSEQVEPAPSRDESLKALVAMAYCLMARATATDRVVKVPKRLTEDAWPASIDARMAAHLTGAGILIRDARGLEFLSQTVQETLAARALIDAAESGALRASDIWPRHEWWKPNPWTVAAGRACKLCRSLSQPVEPLISWIAVANPGLASELWRDFNAAPLPKTVLETLTTDWLPRMCDPMLEPSPVARAEIGLAMGRFALDKRPGVGLTPDGLPDIAWTYISSSRIRRIREWLGLGRPVPRIDFARYLVTNLQYQAFLDDGGYTDARWWEGLRRKSSKPEQPRWTEPNCPRETVEFEEATAFCRWLSSRLSEREGQTVEISLPTNAQWELGARVLGSNHEPYETYTLGTANCDETQLDRYFKNRQKGVRHFLRRTTPVGIYPAKSPFGLYDTAGNLSEWVSDGHSYEFQGIRFDMPAGNVVRGGGWDYQPANMVIDKRFNGYAKDNIGFRVIRLVRAP